MKAFLITIIAFLAFSITCKAQWTPGPGNIYNTNGGNVGIGTTNPLVALHVGSGTSLTIPNGAGSLFSPQIVSTTTSGVAGVGVAVSNGTNNRRAGFYVDQTNGTWGLSMTYDTGSIPFVIRSGDSEFFRIDNSGNVGIGRTDPKSVLDVRSGATNSTSGQEVMRLSSNYDSATIGSGALLSFASGTNNIVFGQIGSRIEPANKSGLSFSTYSSSLSEKMRITADGNVGIGTTTPGSFLSLGTHGTSTVGNANMLRLFDSGTNSYGFGLNTSSGELAATAGTGGFQTFYTANTERMRIVQNGNVGIGTMSPDQKLTVNGTVHAKSVVVDTSVPTPDYVFKSDYKLSTLAEIKAYTDKNHHLPGVPAAAEMEKNGINLGEMNMALLKKVEELTLYLVEKDKEQKEQAATNYSLETKLKTQQQQIDQLNRKLGELINKTK